MPDTAKIRVRRTKTGNEGVVAFSYNDSKNPSQTTTFVADPEKNEFDMTPEQAFSAVETGGFEVDPSSKSEAQEAAE